MIEITTDYLAQQGLSPTFPKRFWNKVRKTESCWIWTASKDACGYGQIARGIGHSAPPIHAARASWILHKGPIPLGLCVLHNCPNGDNPSCVNPSHLWLGTRAENCHDRHHKGRTRTGTTRGEDNPRHKLTWESVKELRQSFSKGVAIRALAKKYGVSQRAIQFCVRMETWKHDYS